MTLFFTYTPTLINTVGALPVTFSVSSGTLQTGLSLNTSTGTISGTPSASSTRTIVLRATYPGGHVDSNSFLLQVWTLPSFGAISTPQTAFQNAAFTFTPSVTNPDSLTITYSMVGTLPSGLSINSSTGVISGTPTTLQTVTGLKIRGSFTTVDSVVHTFDSGSFEIDVVTADSPPLTTATLWISALDAASMTMSGSNVVNVTNKGTVGGVFNGQPVSSPTSRPVLDPTGIGGRPAFLFDYTVDTFQGAGFVAPNNPQSALNIFSSTALTCFVVLKHRTIDPSFDQIVAGEDEQNIGDQSLRLTTGPKFGEVHASMYVFPQAGAVFGPLNPPLATATPVVYAYRLTPGVGYDVRVYTGGGRVTPGPNDTGPSFPGATLNPTMASTGFAIARKTTTTSIRAFDGWIAKIFGFNTAFNNTQVDAQAAALCAEFGI